MHKTRCHWCTNDPLYITYHDQEWGVPVYDDQLLFEMLILEGMQAGLSWLTILKRRQSFRQAFANFNAKKISQYDQTKMDLLLQDPGIIRNKLKVQAAITNAKAYLQVKQEWPSFSAYIWHFVKDQPISNTRAIPVKTAVSDAMSKDLKQRGFKFVGSTICYAFMQAVGMVNDHADDCFRYQELLNRDDRGDSAKS